MPNKDVRDVQLTIAMPCLNADATVRKALTSLRRQTDKKFQLIILDGGSTDKTLDIVNDFNDIVDLTKSQLDSCAQEAVNNILNVAYGKYFMLMSADDWLDVQAVEHIQKVLSGNSDPDLVGFGVIEFIREPSGRLKKNRIFPSSGGIFGLEEGMYCHGCSHVYRRNILIEIGGFQYKDYRLMGDRDLHIRLGLQRLTKVNISKNLYNFRSHSASKTANGRADFGAEAMEDYKKIAHSQLQMVSSPADRALLKGWFLYASVRQCFFYLKQGKILQAVSSLYKGFIAAGFEAFSFLSVVRTPIRFKPKKI